MNDTAVRVKICGITRLEDALVAAEAGADFLGFNFYPQSPRYITPERAAAIILALPAGVHPVGLFVNAPLTMVQETIRQCGLRWVQLSGDEPPEFVWALAPYAFKTLRPRSLAEAEMLTARYVPVGSTTADAPLLLIDAYHPQHYGGTGALADWCIAAAISSHYRVMLAGGLTPENVAEAVRRVRPWGVDVASGVESAPGIKDAAKVFAFVQAAKSPDVAQDDQGMKQRVSGGIS